MEDISLHLLDIAQNSLEAGAGCLLISIEVNTSEDTLVVTIKDDGAGMDEETLRELTDPFFTTKAKKVGLGIPLIAQAARETGGSVSVESVAGKGTCLKAIFRFSHIDRKPVGDIASTLIALIAGAPDTDILFKYKIDDNEYLFDTYHIRHELGDVPLNFSPVLKYLREEILSGIRMVEG
jgi:hypothetical protein